jgi:hypothetical protein
MVAFQAAAANADFSKVKDFYLFDMLIMEVETLCVPPTNPDDRDGKR